MHYSKPIPLASALTLLVFTATPLPLLAQPVRIERGHVDIGFAYEDNSWDAHIHDETTDQEHSPNEAVLVIGSKAASRVPTDARFSFLGAPGRSIHVLPQIEDENLPFLGLAAEEIEPGVFAENKLRVDLLGINGPGHFFLYRTSGVTATPTISYDTSNGISPEDTVNLLAGGHQDFSWAFTSPGDYTLVLQASGTLVEGARFVASAPVDVRFHVVPEPAPVLLLMLGLGLVLGRKLTLPRQ
ncbi:MAG: PEP-CTERM sorting domain-containing protein [Verrucomicrobia bacterium]|nr:PEP-CTERM sorting domain-containing protein [Verrucomicrobiota bacterium]